MGEIRASVTLENSGDRGMRDRGHGAEVRRTTVEGVVDTGAVSLVIPEEIATELGLSGSGEPEPSCTPPAGASNGPWPTSRSRSETSLRTPTPSSDRPGARS